MTIICCDGTILAKEEPMRIGVAYYKKVHDHFNVEGLISIGVHRAGSFWLIKCDTKEEGLKALREYYNYLWC